MYQWRKDIVTWRVRDTLYVSVPFTWLLPEAEQVAKLHKGKVIAGGPAVALMGAPWADETSAECIFDVMAFYNPCMTKTTRGCPHKCPFCVVSKIEGEFRELETWKIAPIICDNNFFASSRRHFLRVIESVKSFPIIDIQGADARYLSVWHIDVLSNLRHVILRFGFDQQEQERDIEPTIMLCKLTGINDVRVYVLIGFDDTPDEARYKLELVRSWGIWPTPMRYQPLDALRKNSYVAPGWTDLELRRMTRYYSRLRWFEHIPYEDFDYLQSEERQEQLAV